MTALSIDSSAGAWLLVAGTSVFLGTILAIGSFVLSLAAFIIDAQSLLALGICLWAAGAILSSLCLFDGADYLFLIAILAGPVGMFCGLFIRAKI